MSPGGRTPSSSRSWPELPPLSNIVTTALTWSQGLLFRPPRTLGMPVPPPKQPMLNSRKTHSLIILSMTDASSALQTLERDLREIFGSRLQSLVRYGASAGRQRRTSRHARPHEPPGAHTRGRRDADRRRSCAPARSASPRGTTRDIATPLMLAEAELSGRSTCFRSSSAPSSPTTPSSPAGRNRSRGFTSNQLTCVGRAKCRRAATCSIFAKATSKPADATTRWRCSSCGRRRRGRRCSKTWRGSRTG